MIIICLAVVTVFSIQDIIEDSLLNQDWYYLLADLAYVSVFLWLLSYLWRYTPLAAKKKNILLTQEVIKHNKDAENWSNKAKHLLHGLSKIISEQMNAWKLSNAEKQVALLLLKGMSLKEIAQIRTTSERTVRQQAMHIYSKSGVSGRAELSAFFLEDLLLPEQA
jgi:DNA-binding CsgD family transcriptional regulator